MNKRRWKRLIQAGLRRLGVSVRVWTASPEARLGFLLKNYQIETVLDVGANVGQYARMLRRDLGYGGKIISFEPMAREYRILSKTAGNDPAWEVHNCALGEADSQMMINVAQNSVSSSFLPATSRLSQAAPQTSCIGEENVTVRKLDTIFDRLKLSSESMWLKVDAQGFESRVIKGAEKSLTSISTVQLEMALAQVYDGEAMFEDLIMEMYGKGYRLVHLIPGLYDSNNGELLELDGIFHRDAGAGA